MMAQKFNSQDKVTIREQWNKPLLDFLCQKLNDKLIYLGLPGPEAIDVLTWIDHIKAVIAFQCRHPKNEFSNNQNDVSSLRRILFNLHRGGKIDRQIVYDGMMERIVLSGVDLSTPIQRFVLSEIVTLYNLDFCNHLGSPFPLVTKEGKFIKDVYKFEVIDRLLKEQKRIQNAKRTPAKFVLFLTTQCSYGKNDGFGEIINFINAEQPREVKEYIDKFLSFTSYDKNSRIVRLYVARELSAQFAYYGFIPFFAPTIFYTGNNSTDKLLHFVILGIGSKANDAAQTLDELMKQKFIGFHENRFVNHGINSEVDVGLNLVDNFSNSRVFQEIWDAPNSTRRAELQE